MKGHNTMRKISAGLIALVGVGVMAGCTTNNTVGNPRFTTHAKLQLAVGTLNDSSGTLTSVPGTYLNAVSTFRNQFGASAYINPGTSTLALPGGGSATTCGLFSYGQNPAAMVAPFGNPLGFGPMGLYAPIFGVPPAYSPADANGIGYALGYLLFLTAGDANNAPCSQFVLPPAATLGAYTLATSVATNGHSISYSATATLGGAPLVLPVEPAPTYVPGAPGTGGGTFTIVKPAGVTESLIAVVDSSSFAELTTVATTTTTAVVPDGTIATGEPCVAFVVGADYPLVESGPPSNTQQTPTITGAGGSADLTVSNAVALPPQP
jgi:hypothetical protein